MEVILSLGSNLGERLRNLADAVCEISRIKDSAIVARAPIYETEPVDVPEQWASQTYFNTAVVLETTLDVDAVSTEIHAIEDRLGRKREGRHAPRTIDIDIITAGDSVCARADLRLPHPEAAMRRFVCQPISDIRPNCILPKQKQTVAEILRGLPEQPAVKLAAEQWPDEVTQ